MLQSPLPSARIVMVLRGSSSARQVPTNSLGMGSAPRGSLGLNGGSSSAARTTKANPKMNASMTPRQPAAQPKIKSRGPRRGGNGGGVEAGAFTVPLIAGGKSQ